MPFSFKDILISYRMMCGGKWIKIASYVDLPHKVVIYALLKIITMIIIDKNNTLATIEIFCQLGNFFNYASTISLLGIKEVEKVDQNSVI
jgi:hypothetical protein